MRNEYPIYLKQPPSYESLSWLKKSRRTKKMYQLTKEIYNLERQLWEMLEEEAPQPCLEKIGYIASDYVEMIININCTCEEAMCQTKTRYLCKWWQFWKRPYHTYHK